MNLTGSSELLGTRISGKQDTSTEYGASPTTAGTANKPKNEEFSVPQLLTLVCIHK